jgi:hypothetical protein
MTLHLPAAACNEVLIWGGPLAKVARKYGSARHTQTLAYKGPRVHSKEDYSHGLNLIQFAGRGTYELCL